MEFIRLLLVSSYGDLKRNKVRTFLTSLGIMIGVLSVVLLIAFGVGLRNYIQGQFESLGTNLLYVVPGQVVGSGGNLRSSAIAGPRFDEKDLRKLQKIPNVDYVVPIMVRTGSIDASGKSESSQLMGSTIDIASALNLETEFGRFFTKADTDKRAKVVVLGPKLSEKFFGDAASGLGKTVRIANQSFRVIGILKAKGGGALGGPDFDNMSFVPYKAMFSLNPDKKFFEFYIRSQTEKEIPVIKEEATRVLAKRYDKDEYQVVEQTEILNIVTSIFSILNTILVAIGSISLLVGGIGIMNIMYATVTERIKEIGIRRAIGATKQDILFQFLTEAVILSLFGGLLGLALAFLIVFLIQPIFPAGIDTISVIAALGVSSFIGIFFGVFPARRAANLSPIEAIRYE